MSVLYRDHRGGLDDSMQTVQELDLQGIQDHLHKLFGPGIIEVKKYGFDPRINWDTHVVTHNGRAVGFTNGAILLCGRCYKEVTELFPSECNEKPEKLLGAPMGQYHCPDCGAMLLAGLPHFDLCQDCLSR